MSDAESQTTRSGHLNISLNRIDEIRDAVKDAPLQTIRRQIPEESFHHVDCLSLLWFLDNWGGIIEKPAGSFA